MSQNLKFFLEITIATSSILKRRGTILLGISTQFKSLHFWWYGDALLPTELAACPAGRVLLMLKDIHRFWSNICSHSDDIFFKDSLAYFSETMLTTGAELACNSDLSPTGNIWRLNKCKIRERRHRSVEQLDSYISQEWENFPLPKVQNLVSSVLRCLQTVENGMLQSET